MPVVLRIRNFRFYFYSHEHEPKHIHITKGRGSPDLEVKIELETLNVVRVRGFSRQDVGQLVSIVREYQEQLIELWEDYFSDEQD